MENYNAVEQHKAALAAVNVAGASTPKLENIGNCMTSGCDPTGHLNGSFLTHRAITNCSNSKKPAISKYPSAQTHNDLYQLYQKGLNSKFANGFTRRNVAVTCFRKGGIGVCLCSKKARSCDPNWMQFRMNE